MASHHTFFVNELSELTLDIEKKYGKLLVMLHHGPVRILRKQDVLRINHAGKLFAHFDVGDDLTLRCAWCTEPVDEMVYVGGVCSDCHEGED